jgi:methyltransferase (TIGR00027 family)
MAEVAAAPDGTAVRVALWRAMHVMVDPPPHVLEDEVGLKLAAPADGWRRRPDMDPDTTRLFRASIVARARFIEDLVAERADGGVGQYVILGAGLDTFAERRPDLAARVRVYEVDQPGHVAWKRERLATLGYGMPDGLRLVPVDFAAGRSWCDGIAAAGFDAARPAVVAATGLSMYLTREANLAMLREVAGLVPDSTLAMTFLLPAELVADELKLGLEISAKGAAASGSPFLSYFSPAEALALAREAGFKDARHIPAADLNARYFAGRSDGLHVASGEEILVATT